MTWSLQLILRGEFAPIGLHLYRITPDLELLRLGELLVNITPAEKLRFALLQWMSKGDFIGFFREEVPSKSGFLYGDIFVKMREPASTSS
jgi:hypothetical protein